MLIYNYVSDLDTRIASDLFLATGVIGRKKFAFDLWGDTINVGSRMESSSLPGRIHCSRSTYERVYDLGYEFEERFVEVKGKGHLQTYLLKEKHHKNPTQLTSLMVQHENHEQGNNNIL